MLKTNRNFLLAYFFLVILPVAGLLGILRHGRNLAAPVSVGGVWKIQAGPSSPDGLPCSELLASLRDASIVISQSGKDLSLTLPNGWRESNSGILDGATLTASFLPLEVKSGCAADRAFTLTATVDAKSTPRSFSGMLSVAGCPTCAAALVSATREERAAGKAGQ